MEGRAPAAPASQELGPPMKSVPRKRPAVIDRRYNFALPRRSLGEGGSRHHLRAHRATLPAREPSPIRPNVRLRSAGRTSRDRKSTASLRFPARRLSAPHSSITGRLLRPRFSPLPFVCHKFLSSDFPVASLRRSHLEDFHFSTRAQSPAAPSSCSRRPAADATLALMRMSISRSPHASVYNLPQLTEL
jgi:hypothetical protein